jgi:hypothetical protein
MKGTFSRRDDPSTSSFCWESVGAERCGVPWEYSSITLMKSQRGFASSGRTPLPP